MSKLWDRKYMSASNVGKVEGFKYLNNSYNNMYVITCQITMIVECRVYCLNDKKCNLTNTGNWKENTCICIYCDLSKYTVHAFIIKAFIDSKVDNHKIL